MATGHLGHVTGRYAHAFGQLLHAHAQLSGTLPDVAALPVHHTALAVDDPLPGDLPQHRHRLLPHPRRPRLAARRKPGQVARGHTHLVGKLLHREPAAPRCGPELRLSRRRLLRPIADCRRCRRHHDLLRAVFAFRPGPACGQRRRAVSNETALGLWDVLWGAEGSVVSGDEASPRGGARRTGRATARRRRGPSCSGRRR